MNGPLAGQARLLVAVVMATIIVLPHWIERPPRERWFMPGDLGAEQADATRLRREEESTSQPPVRRRPGEGGSLGEGGSALNSHPGFTTRSMYGGRGDAGREWERRNGIGPRIDFSHALNRIFPPELHLVHPEFFPLVNGERLQPPRGSYFWQPDLGREDVAAWAADAARRHFEQSPEAASFAVGVNDGLIFGESEEMMALVKGGKQKAESRKRKTDGAHESHEKATQEEGFGIGLSTLNPQPATQPDPSTLNPQRSTANAVRYFRQRPDFTDLVYTFTNRVARDVARTHPDKYVGALAYYWCENAPGFLLEPNVIPFLTADRSQGYDETFLREERALQRAWARAHGRDGSPFAQASENRGTVRGGAAGGVAVARTGDAVRRLSGETVSQPNRVTVSLETADEDVRAPATLSTQRSALNSAEAALPRRLGLYDYLYGSGFLIPRVHTRLIADNLRHAHRLGFTDYFAELNPNWGLDGPMAWMVAQLLEDPEQSREVLLDEYYERYFREAAVPMRRFFERCEYQWMTQPGPAYWLKHYRNESQAALFPSAVCRELRGLLDDAARRARNDVTRRRVGFVSDAFGVTERFIAFCEARDALNRAVLRGTRGEGLDPTRVDLGSTLVQINQPGLGLQETNRGRGEVGRTEAQRRFSSQLSALNSRFVETRSAFVDYTAALMEREPLALAPFVWEDYLRHEPPLAADAARNPNIEIRNPMSEKEDAAVAADASTNPVEIRNPKSEKGAAVSAAAVEDSKGESQKPSGGRRFTYPKSVQSAGAAGQPQGANLPRARRTTAFTDFRDLTAQPIQPAWTLGGIPYGVALPEGWQSYVEPSEFQQAELRDGVLRLTGNKETFVYQWIPAQAGEASAASVTVRGEAGPSTTVILALSWLDAEQRRLGYKIHRLPEGEWPDWLTLQAADTAPEGAAWIGVGLRVQNQMGRDWIEATEFRLETQKAEN